MTTVSIDVYFMALKFPKFVGEKKKDFKNVFNFAKQVQCVRLEIGFNGRNGT